MSEKPERGAPFSERLAYSQRMWDEFSESPKGKVVLSVADWVIAIVVAAGLILCVAAFAGGCAPSRRDGPGARPVPGHSVGANCAPGSYSVGGRLSL